MLETVQLDLIQADGSYSSVDLVQRVSLSILGMGTTYDKYLETNRILLEEDCESASSQRIWCWQLKTFQVSKKKKNKNQLTKQNKKHPEANMLFSKKPFTESNVKILH